MKKQAKSVEANSPRVIIEFTCGHRFYINASKKDRCPKECPNCTAPFKGFADETKKPAVNTEDKTRIKTLSDSISNKILTDEESAKKAAIILSEWLNKDNKKKAA